MTFAGLMTSGAKSASVIGTGVAPDRAGAAAGSPDASSSPTSAASSGISVSDSSRAAVVPALVRIVAKRMDGTLVRSAPGESDGDNRCWAGPQPSPPRPLCQDWAGDTGEIYDRSDEGSASVEDRRRPRQLSQ